MKSDKLIFVPFAFDEDAKSGVNITLTGEAAKQMYLQNAAVALCSAKHYNPDDTVALVTNLPPEDIPLSIRQVLQQAEVEIKQIPFDRFVFPKDYKWSLAFYKLCALSYIVEQTDYRYISYVDADVYVQQSFEPIWQAAQEAILLVDNHKNLRNENYRVFVSEIQHFLQTQTKPIHWEGGFLAATRENAVLLLQQAQEIYQQMCGRQVQTLMGDEFILGVAALRLKELVQDGWEFAAHFWTNPLRREVPPVYQEPTMAVLHLPAEKQRGLLTLYRRFISQGKIPSPAQVHKICRLSKQPIGDKILLQGYKMLISFLPAKWVDKGIQKLRRTFSRG